MKLKKIFALCISAAVMLTGCIQKNDDVELSEEEKEHNAVIPTADKVGRKLVETLKQTVESLLTKQTE